jgi:glycogen debranching enzyme
MKSADPHECRGIDHVMDAAIELPRHYVEADGSLVQRPLRNLKHGDAFAVFDNYGDIGVIGTGPEGLYFNDTRFLSWFELRFEGRRPLILSSVVQDDHAALSVDLANPDVHRDGMILLPRDTISIERTKFLWEAVCYERIGFRNYTDEHRRFRIEIGFGADFRDLFEVRGTVRERRGKISFKIEKDWVEFHYHGLDGRVRRTKLKFWPPPVKISPNRAVFEVDLGPNAKASLFTSVLCIDEVVPKVEDFGLALRDRRREIRARTANIARIESSNELFNEICRRSVSDLYMLMTHTEHGYYPYAGIPWYCTAFGRDGIITAMVSLWLDAAIAKGVLLYLGATQAKSVDPSCDAQPGKILHETRSGEMARLGEVPFRHYFGSVDATPLYIMLAGMYFHRTGDMDTLRLVWPNILAALNWIDTYGDMDGDGFVEYARQADSGLANQGWKDSYDSIFHADGCLAEGPIALCEVQAYVFSAKLHAAKLAKCFDDHDLAAKLTADAQVLKQKFSAAFWCEDIGTFVLALDGKKHPCKVRTSNAGHALFAGIATPEQAARVAKSLLGRDFFSGWGVRTVAQGEARYNPLSYHNGSIWPHDNAMIALGFSRYGLVRQAAEIFTALFEVATHEELGRFPELFCGLIRRPHRGPTSYPVACTPQAWAAVAPLAFLEACFGLEISHASNSISFVEPIVPDFLDHVTLRQLSVGESCFDFKLHRHGADATLAVLHRRGSAKVMILK